MSSPIRTLGSPSPPALIFDPPAWWKVALTLLAVVIVQTTLVPQLAFRGAVPSLVLLLVLWYGMRTGVVSGLLFGTIAGACEDALAGWTGGAYGVGKRIDIGDDVRARDEPEADRVGAAHHGDVEADTVVHRPERVEREQRRASEIERHGRSRHVRDQQVHDCRNS